VEEQEYRHLSTAERNQRALDRYLARGKSSWEIGRVYERYVGFVYETAGWSVVFQGAIKGFEDFGRDLICTNRLDVHIVQAKCWSHLKVIREKHIFQLFGTTVHIAALCSPRSCPCLSPPQSYLRGHRSRQIAGSAVCKWPLRTDYPMVVQREQRDERRSITCPSTSSTTR
jgi:hypothetical protein